MSRVWDSSKLKGSELLLLLAIADNARDDGHAWPGLSLLAAKTRLSRPTVSKKLSALVESGELYIHAMKGYVHHYVVLVEMAPEDQAEIIAKIEEKRGQKSEYKPGGRKHGVTGEPVNTGLRGSQTRGYGGGKHGATRSVTNHQESSSSGDEDDAFDIIEAYHRICGRMVASEYQKDELISIEAEFPSDWITDAFKKAVNAGARNPIGYAQTCLADWRIKGRGGEAEQTATSLFIGQTVV